MNLPNKAKKRINRTKNTLKEYGCRFTEYMAESCHRRDDIELGETVVIGDKKGIVCGWNGSCNFDIYFIDKEVIRNVHPSDVEKI